MTAMKKSIPIVTIAAKYRNHAIHAIQNEEREWRAFILSEYPTVDETDPTTGESAERKRADSELPEIELIISEPNEHGRCALDVEYIEGYGEFVLEDVLTANKIPWRQEPSIYSIDLAQNPIAVSDTPVWVRTRWDIVYHHIGDVIPT